MPAPTRYNRQIDNRKAAQTPFRVGTTAASFGAPQGQAMGQVEQGLLTVAEAVDARQAMEADANAREATEGYRDRQRQIMRDPETGYLNQTGANALDARERTLTELEKAREEFGKNLDPRARKAYDRSVDGLQSTAKDQAVNHESTQSRNYVTNARQSTIEGFTEDAIANWNDPAAFEGNLQKAVDEQAELAALEGWDDETLRNSQEKLISKSVRDAAVMMADSDPSEVEAFIEENRGRLTAADEHELDTNMKQMILEQKAQSFVKGYVAPPGSGTSGAGDGSTDTYERAMLRAESGGNPNAANPNSSAVGRAQFLSGTYLSEVSKMQAKGLAPWAAGMSRQELLDTRRNPRYEREVWEFFRAGNQAQIRAVGAEVTATTEYAMHFFGDGAGPAIMRAVQQNPGKPMKAIYDSIGASWARVVRDNRGSGLRMGDTAAQALDWASSKMNDDGSRTDKNFFDEGAAIQAAMQIEDPELQNAVIQRIGQISSLQQRQRQAEQQSATETAYDLYLSEGVTELPYTLRQKMGPSGYSSWKTAVEQDMVGIDITDPDTHELLTRMASQEPQEFAELDLSQHYPNLSRADRRDFVQQQEAVRTKIDGQPGEAKGYGMDFAKAADDTDDIYKAFVEGADKVPSEMTQEDRQRRIEYERRLRQTMLSFYEREQREPTRTEIRDMAMALTMPTTFSVQRENAAGQFVLGDKTEEGAFFETGSKADNATAEPNVSYDAIPYEDRSRIRAVLQEQNGVPPTEDEVTEYYENERVVRLGGSPTVAPEDVPEWFRTEIAKEEPGATELDIAQMYQSFETYRIGRNLGKIGPMAQSTLGAEGFDAPASGTPAMTGSEVSAPPPVGGTPASPPLPDQEKDVPDFGPRRPVPPKAEPRGLAAVGQPIGAGPQTPSYQQRPPQPDLPGEMPDGGSEAERVIGGLTEGARQVFGDRGIVKRMERAASGNMSRSQQQALIHELWREVRRAPDTPARAELMQQLLDLQS